MNIKLLFKKYNYAWTALIFIIGVLSIMIGYLSKPTIKINGIETINSDLKNLFMSIGCSIIASCIISFLTQKYVETKDDAIELAKKWGLRNIYNTRENANSFSIDKKFKNLNNQLDIIAFGLDHFRNSKERIFIEKIRKNKNLSVRILTLNPDSIFVTQREQDENKNEGSIKKSIKDLSSWVNKINQNTKSNHIQIKYYDALPLDSYLRVDDIIYVGPYEHNKMSSQSITYEFEEGGQGYNYYSEYFQDLWTNSDLSKCSLDEFEKKLPECEYPHNKKNCYEFYKDGLEKYFSSYTEISNFEITDHIKKSKSVKLIEIYSERNIQDYFNAYKEMITKNNGTLDVIILDSSEPNTDGFKYLNSKFIAGNNINGNIMASTHKCIDNTKLLGEISRLKESVGDFKNNINIYYTDYIPQYSAILIDNIVYVVLYKTSPGRNSDIPAFKITKQGDSKFYDFVAEDIKYLMENSKK